MFLASSQLSVATDDIVEVWFLAEFVSEKHLSLLTDAASRWQFIVEVLDRSCALNHGHVGLQGLS